MASAGTATAEHSSRSLVGWAGTDRETEAEVHRLYRKASYSPHAEVTNVTSMAPLVSGGAATSHPERSIPFTRTETHPSIADWVRSRLRPEPDRLARRIGIVFDLAREELFEDGMESEFSRALITLIHSHGNAAISAIEKTLQSGHVSSEIAQEALRWLGALAHSESHKYRLLILRGYLEAPIAPIRDAAGLGLAAMDDPTAIPAIMEAIRNETYPQLRQNLQLVLIQLEDT